ncbi:MAG TPA: SDR family oxidoreductase [Trebonia sp.]|jgi:crotonobetainyl-CoA:carnitine CoA-transferase CaiB-like acyl-CoA transferase|nr:SDR family oxidoreductase [Trebonia sp.]
MTDDTLPEEPTSRRAQPGTTRDGPIQGQGALAGLRVVDFTAVVAGPYCTRLMADLGADVIKIEPPAGEHIRSIPPVRDGQSAYFGQFNAGKRSVVLDLKDTDGLMAANELVNWSDVVVENFRPGVMARFGLDYPTIAARRPEIVYCSISGYGQDGAWSNRPAVAQAVTASSGYDLSLMTHQHGLDAPLVTGIFPADLMGAALAFGGILAALRARDESAVGRLVDVALIDGLLTMLTSDLMKAQFPGDYTIRTYPPFRTADGHVMIAAINQTNFEALANVIGQPSLIADPRFLDNSRRWENSRALEHEVEAWTSSRSAEECERLMLEAGVPAARYRTVAEQLSSERLQHRGSFASTRDSAGTYLVTSNPFHLSLPVQSEGPPPAGKQPGELTVPELGSHTYEVLAGLVGPAVAQRLARKVGTVPPARSAPPVADDPRPGCRMRAGRPGQRALSRPGNRRRRAAQRGAAQAHLLPAVPMRRIGRPEEVAGGALYLASDAASYTTGHVIFANGGRPA